MYLNTGWIGGTLYLFLVLTTLVLGLKLVLGDRGGDGVIAVPVAASFGMALEGAVIDTDHWRYFYLIMAMVWGWPWHAAPGSAHDHSAKWSERGDLNSRPPVPQTGALTGLRHAPTSR